MCFYFKKCQWPCCVLSSAKKPPTTGQVVDVFRQSAQAPHAELHKILAESFSEFNNCEPLTLYVKVKRAAEKSKQLRGKAKEQFLEAPFVPPIQKTNFVETVSEHDTEASLSEKFQSVTIKAKQLENKHKALKRQFSECEGNLEKLTVEKDQAQNKVNVLQSLLEMANTKVTETLTNSKINADEMKSEINEWETKYKMLARQFDQATEQLKIKTDKLKAKDTRNLNKKIKRREQTIEKQSNELQEISEEKENLTEAVLTLKKDKKSLLQKVCKLKKKMTFWN